MNKYVIVLANAGMSGNFLMRLINFSRAIEWNKSNHYRSDDIVSKDADDQYINYCWTSLCHTAVSSTAHKLAHKWYMDTRTRVDMDTWHAIKKASNRPSAWFFHDVADAVRADPETVIVQVVPGWDYDVQMMLDRWCFNGEVQDFNNNYSNAENWFREMMTSINHLGNSTFKKSGADVLYMNRDIFDSAKVLTLLDELGLYHAGMADIIHDWIKVYLIKNTRPKGLMSKSSPKVYRYKEEIEQIHDPHIRHLLKCVNREDWPTLDLIDDPYDYLIRFQRKLRNGANFAETFNDTLEQFNTWQKQLDA